MMQSSFARRAQTMLAVTVALLLIGCAPRPAAQTAQAADDAACRQEAYNDPQVRALFNQALIQGRNPPIFDFSFTTAQEDARYAYRQAVLACMTRYGLGGGVEPVRQYPFSPLGF